MVMEILIHDSRESSFVQLCYISFLFALRVPSEALQLRRAFKHDDLSMFAPPKDRDLIALQGPPGGARLIIRFARR